MNRILKCSVCVALSMAAGWGGRELSLRLHREWTGAAPGGTRSTTSPVAGGAPAAEKEAPEDADDASLAARKAAARCTTAALWDLIQSGKEIPFALRSAVTQELLDREGVAAIEHCEALPDRKTAGEWTGRLLKDLARRDCWRAQDLYRALPDDLAGMTDSSFGNALVEGSAETSADAMIRMLEKLKRPGGDYRFLSLPSGFDFRKVLDHGLEAGHEGPSLVPTYLLFGWAGQSPLAALEWARAHPDYADDPDPDSSGMGAIQQVMTAAAMNSEGPQRSEALLRGAQYVSPEQRAALWLNMGGGPGVDPELAKIAAEIGPEDAKIYLVKCLAGTRGSDSQDAGWAEIPAELREPAMAQALEEWRNQDPTPSGDQARQYWKAGMERLFKGP